MRHRIFTGCTGDEEVLVQVWDEDDGTTTAQVAFRPGPPWTWGPPTALVEVPS